MTNLQPIIDDLTSVRDRMAGMKLDHPWDENIRRNTIPRLDAALSDLRVVACRMLEDIRLLTQDERAVIESAPMPDVVAKALSESLDEPEPQPITEDLMRRAQVGWVVRTAGGDKGRVCHIRDGSFNVYFPGALVTTYDVEDCGRYKGNPGYDIVSLSPPAVVADPPEIIL